MRSGSAAAGEGLEKSEGWGTQLDWRVKGGPPASVILLRNGLRRILTAKPDEGLNYIGVEAND